MNERKLIGGFIVGAACCAWAYILIAGQPRLPVDAADGTFTNQCCGEVTLKDGVISVGSQRLNYLIESEKIGPYVLPKVIVGASNKGFVIRPDGYSLKLRLDRTADPMNIELIDERPNAGTFSFIRTKVR
jgi:hypothetical protein